MNNSYQTRIDQAKKAIENAEYIVVGGGAGLSDAAGIHFSGERFEKHFAPFIEKYGMTDLYTSSFYPFKTQEERWAYWAKHISLNRYEVGATQLYGDVFQLVKDTKHFVISTNVESQFEKAGFAPDKVFQTQGDYCYLQCAKACHNNRYYNEALIKEMLEQTVDCTIPSRLVPICPVCGGAMDVNLRYNEYFVQDSRWYELSMFYNNFLKDSAGKKVVYLELGVGFNTPDIIRYPFERMTYENKSASLIRLNKHHPESMEENKDKTIAFTEDMQEVLSAIMK